MKLNIYNSSDLFSNILKKLPNEHPGDVAEFVNKNEFNINNTLEDIIKSYNKYMKKPSIEENEEEEDLHGEII